MLTLRFRREGHAWAILELQDDGRGIDVDRVRRKALSNGLLDEAKASAWSEERILDLIFEPGFSTAEAVTDVSGRGVGMDAVRTAMAALGGSVRVESKVGSGCRVELRIPSRILTQGLSSDETAG